MINIIIPVYNVEKYLRRCLDSVVNQTSENFRAIVVDDGSTDYSGAICDEYAKKDYRIIVYHKQNGGLSSAVRYGIENSPECDYYMFLDGDDSLEADVVKDVVDIVEKEKVDIVMYDFFIVEENGKILKTITSNLNEGNISTDLATIKEGYLFNKNVVPARWNKVFEASVAKETLKYYDDEVTVAEDLLFTTVSLFNSKSLYYYKKPLINYYQNGGSMTHKFSENYFQSYRTVYRRLNEFFDEGKVADAAFFQNVKTLVQNIILCDLTWREKKRQIDNVRKDVDFIKLTNRYTPQNKKDKIIKNLILKGRYTILKILTRINNK